MSAKKVSFFLFERKKIVDMEKKEHMKAVNEQPSKKLFDIRSYIAALLMLIPSMHAQSVVNSNEQNASLFAAYQKHPNTGIEMNETIEISDEELFKAIFAKAIGPINKLTDIPAGWIVLSYPSSTTLPKTIDFFPKKMIADKLPYSVLKIGEKMFTVTPDMWFEVDDMYIDATEFTVVVSMDSRLGEITKTTSKNKEDELWEYLRKVYSEGADGRYLGSTVKEIPKSLQKMFLEEYNKLNK